MAFHELARWEIDSRPGALVSTAATLSPALKTSLEVRYGCPVIDLYSTTETGPIAYSDPDGEGFCLLPPDLYVEIIDTDGFPLAPGDFGEIAVSGGRNPYLPLLRYRTGDFARLRPEGTVADPAPRLYDLQARQPVRLRAASGALVHPLDIGYVLRRQTWVQHELVQRADGSLRLVLRPGSDQSLDRDALRAGLEELFGPLPIEILEDPRLGADRPGGKVIAYRAE